MTNNELLATFSGWTFTNTNGMIDWTDPNDLNPMTKIWANNSLPDFTTDYNLFVPVWNKAIDELEYMGDQDLGYVLLETAGDMGLSFNIESRLPVLIGIIEYLNSVKK
jgi:hypothetical protein